jgi:hypothetical protein
MGSLNSSLVLMHAIDKNASRESIIIPFNTMAFDAGGALKATKTTTTPLLTATETLDAMKKASGADYTHLQWRDRHLSL